jgi:hypothetical protein
MITAGQFKKGVAVTLDGAHWVVEDLVDRGTPASQTGQWPCQWRLRAEKYQADRSPPCAR